MFQSALQLYMFWQEAALTAGEMFCKHLRERHIQTTCMEKLVAAIAPMPILSIVVTFRLYYPTVFSKLQNVNIILLGTFPNATDTFSDASIVYYSSKRYMRHHHFWKTAWHFI